VRREPPLLHDWLRDLPRSASADLAAPARGFFFFAIIPVALLLRLFPKDTTIGEIARLFRCTQCGLRGARIRAEYVGPVGDGRS